MSQQEILLKICFLGGARYVYPLDVTSEKKFRALTVLGELFVVGFSHSIRPRLFVQHACFYLLPKLPIPFLRYAEMLVVGTPLVLWLILRHGVEVLVAQSPYEGFAAALAKKIAGWFRYRVALVVETHGDFEESLFMQRSVVFPRLYRFLMRCAAHFAFKHTDVFRTISSSTRCQLESWMPGRPIVQFPAWTDMEVFLQAGINKEKSSQGILYTGVLIPRKGIHHLINAFASVAKDFPEARLFIVGHEENKAYADKLKEQVKRVGVNGRVQFMGAMPQAELATWMRRAIVFALPSLSEGLGRVVVEAMATSTPVIGTNVGGIPEMVQDGSTGLLVPAGDETALAEKIRWVFEHPEETQAMGRHARIFAERFFSGEVFSEGYRQIFEAAQVSITDGSERAASSL